MSSPPGAVVPSGWVEPLLDVARAGLDPSAPRVLVLVGPPGIGRTTTLDRLGRTLQDRGVDVRRVGADDLGRDEPFGALRDLLGLPRGDATGLHSVDRALTAIETLCRRGSLVLAIDDAHRADPDSLEGLVQLAGLTRDLPVGFVVTHSPGPTRAALTTLAMRPDAREVRLRGLDEDSCAEIVRDRYGVAPDARMRELLAEAGGNPFRTTILLDDLDRQGATAVLDGAVTVAATDPRPARSVEASVRAHLGLLDDRCHDVLRVLAVWSEPARPDTLAAVLDTTAAALVGAADRAVGADVLRWTDADRLAFRHDLYATVVLASMDPPVRRVLQEACAAWRPADTAVVSLTPRRLAELPDDALDVPALLKAVALELANAPERTAELLGTLAERVGEGPDADAVAIEQTGAMAVSGRVVEAERIARERRARSSDPATRAALTRLLVFTLVSGAEVDAALREIDAVLGAMPAGAPVGVLTDTRRWIEVLAGRHPVPAAPGASSDGTGATASGVQSDAVEDFLRARCDDALRQAEHATELRSEQDTGRWRQGPTAQVWPAFFALYADGPARARDLSVDARRVVHRDGQLWLTPYHQFVSAGIHVLSGRWDDALAEVESGLEAAESTGTGWISLPTATQLQTRIRRGELDAAAATLARWKTRDLAEQFGLPLVAHAEALLLEARDRPAEAAALVDRTWRRTLAGGRVVWALLVGPEAARIATGAGDDALLARIAAATAEVPVDQARALAPAVDLLAAVAARDPDGAARAAVAYQHVGNVLGEVTAWEHTAYLGAARGERDVADAAARRCAALAGSLGASIIERRLAARLRSLGHRQGSTTTRRRPSSGWESLTPTELEVVDLVAQGLTSPQVAARLFVSPRTIQTHISHVLRKLGLHSRVELAAAVVRHGP